MNTEIKEKKENQTLTLLLMASGIIAIFMTAGYLIFSGVRPINWQCDISIKPNTFAEPYEFDKELK